MLELHIASQIMYMYMYITGSTRTLFLHVQMLPTKSEMGSYAPPYWGSMVSVASIGELSWSLGVLRAVCDR